MKKIFTVNTPQLFWIFRVLGVVSECRGAWYTFCKLGDKVFCENMQNGSWYQIHLWRKDILLMAMVSSDSSVYCIHHIFV